MSTNELTTKVRELKELKAMADELAAEITAIEERIRIDGTMDCDFFITSALFYYGYVEGKRAERAKRKVAA